MQLFSYFRSSSSYRVRIALNLKGVTAQYVPVHLVNNEHLTDAYRQINPDALLPSLVDGPHVLTQSLAICEFLDETYPDPPLLPATPLDRARVRSMALGIACEIHPINNLRVLRYLETELQIGKEARSRWYAHWVERGLTTLEELLRGPQTGRFCHGDQPGLADICLVPQIFNGQRFGVDLSAMPRVMAVFEHCMALEAFERAHPKHQPDAF